MKGSEQSCDNQSKGLKVLTWKKRKFRRKMESVFKFWR